MPTRPHGLLFTRTEVQLADTPQVIEQGRGRCTVSLGRGAVSLHSSSAEALALILAAAERLGGAR
jgi:hypothetical protein